MSLKIRSAIPQSWTDHLGSGRIGVGLDLATTEKETSNPSSITVMERTTPGYTQRLVASWKTADEEVTQGIFLMLIHDIIAAGKKNQLRRACIDGTNERFFAQTLRRLAAGILPVEVVISSEKTRWRGEEFNFKTLLGNLYVSAFEDNLMAMPAGKWLRDDHRLVFRDKGGFVAKIGPNGEHGDTFDSGKLALWALESGGGPVQAAATPTGFSGGAATPRRGLRHRGHVTATLPM